MVRKSRFLLVPATLTLAALASAAVPSPAAPPVVFLNHFFVVVSAESYAAMVADPYLQNTFAPFEKRTTVRNDDTYTAAYWYGRNTYFEVFEPPSQGPAGSSGMAFGVDGTGESAAVRALWETSLGGAQTFTVTRKTEDAEPPWFHLSAGKAAGAGGLRLWLMEYDASFLARWYPELTPARGTLRSEVLDRYAAKVGKAKDRDQAVLRDVTRLVIALDAGDRELLKNHAVPAGWALQPGASPEAFSLAGPEGVVLEVVAATEARRGILEAHFSVQGKPAPHHATLGSVELTVEPTGAVLLFVR